MSVHLIAFTDKGEALAKRIAGIYPGDVLRSHGSEARRNWTEDNFKTGNVLIFVGAMGICIRTIAPYVKDKTTDPAVIVVDEAANHVIPVLSGHLGGANSFAQALAEELGSEAVLTTATDVNGLFAADEWARRNGLKVVNTRRIKYVSSALLAGKTVKVSSDARMSGEIPQGIVMTDTQPDLYIGWKTTGDNVLCLVPPMCVLGIGCRRNTPFETLDEGMENFIREHGIRKEAVKAVATIDLKKDEEGLIKLCVENGWDFITFSSEELSALQGTFTASSFVSSVTGVDNVCERASLLASGEGGKLEVNKCAGNGMTFAMSVCDIQLDWRMN